MKRICNTCKKEKNEDEFHKKKNGEICRNCDKCLYGKKGKCDHGRRELKCKECRKKWWLIIKD